MSFNATYIHSCLQTAGSHIHSSLQTVGSHTGPLAECLTGALGLRIHTKDFLPFLSRLLPHDERIALVYAGVVGAGLLTGYCAVKCLEETGRAARSLCRFDFSKTAKHIGVVTIHAAVPPLIYFVAKQYLEQ